MKDHKTEDVADWLPVVDFNGARYVVDIDRRQFRRFDDPKSSIGFYSEVGRQMAKAMMGTEWSTFTARELWERNDEQVV